jgi:Peptidase M50B-like
MRDADREVVAFHEAGHAVATVVRGGKCCRITIEPDEDYDGQTNVTAAQHNMAFVTYAGPWAEARATWTGPVAGKDEDGSTFKDHVALAFERNAEGDLRQYRLLMADLAAAYGNLNALFTFESETAWGCELEVKWPVIREVAELLMAQVDVSTEVVSALLE